VLFLLIGSAGVYFGRDLAFGSAAKMGPGFFPIILSCIIILIGVVIGVRALAFDGPRISVSRLRPMVVILSAIASVGWLIERAGLVITVVALTFVTAAARPGVDLKETLVLALSLSTFAVVVFVYALGQPMPVWWGG
jgi:hypothetical protein